jgi:hypothetical protein
MPEKKYLGKTQGACSRGLITALFDGGPHITSNAIPPISRAHHELPRVSREGCRLFIFDFSNI